jgi:hypothetical protein
MVLTELQSCLIGAGRRRAISPVRVRQTAAAPIIEADSPRNLTLSESSMNRLSREERLAVLELVTEIASEAARNPNVVWVIEFQEQLVETLYRKMTALLEEPKAKRTALDSDSGPERHEDDIGDEVEDSVQPRRETSHHKSTRKSR